MIIWMMTTLHKQWAKLKTIFELIDFFCFFQRRSAYRIYVLEVLAMLCQDAGVSDGNLVDRMDTIYNDIFDMEKFLAEVYIYKNL